MAVVAFLTGLVVSLVLGRWMIWLGPRLGIVDHPDDHLKPHSGSPVPLGGVAVLVGAIAGLVVANVLETGLLASVLVVWLIGLVDDIRGLSPVIRLLGALAAGVLLVTLGESPIEPALAVFWVVAVVVVVNGINLFDGLDALAGSVSTVAIVGMGWFGVTQGAIDPWIVLGIAGALLGFLVWNRPPARLYLGDNGAYVVGVLAVWAAMWGSTDRMGSVVAVGLIGLPLVDLGVTLFRRGLSGSPFFSGDRDHTYDRLRQRGLSDARVVAMFVVAQTIWVLLLVGASGLWGDLIAAIIALVVGLLLAVVLGVGSTLAEG